MTLVIITITTEDNQMTDTKSSEGRRKLLKSIAATTGAVATGSALPKKWHKPLVDTVVLPAHALTTGCPSCTGPETSVTTEGTLSFTLIDSNTLRIALGEDTVDATVTDNGEFLFEAEQGCDGFV